MRLVLFWTPFCVAFWLVLSTLVVWSSGAREAVMLGPSRFGAAALVVALLWFALLIRALWMPSLAFDRWSYQLRDDQLVIRSGVIIKRAVAIPTHRVQHVDTHQGPLERVLGLARIHIYTASGQGADGVIPGLDAGVAERLRDALVEHRGDDGV
jgi:membrane protein YdbS with pleckstrin-like domain